jgi:amidase
MNRLVFLSAVLLLLCPAVAQAATDFSGTWEIGVREFGAKNYYLPMTDGRLVLEKQASGYVAHYNQLTLTGTQDNNSLQLACAQGGKSCGSFALKLTGKQLAGTGTLLDIPVTFTGKRPVAQPAASTVHDYNPQVFHNVYSPAIAPALHIFPGDSIKTRTLDSRGQDADGKPRAPRGNPLTGPFYVEGAMPGDTLVVHLDRIRTNRDTAYQTNLIANTALEAGYLREIAKHDPGFTSWKIDAAAGTATIVNPSNKMGAYTIKLSPMLGCVGVAPPRDEVFSSGRLGPFGGNLDSPQVREGATLYIPVFQPGALLYFGDGHAQQGEGELPGQGLETSLDVQVTVNLMQNKALGQARLENQDYVMIMGTGVTVDAAMRSATTEMSRWLADTYGFTPQDIAAFLGTAMEYDIAEVVDSEYGVTAKVRKDALAQIRK